MPLIPLALPPGVFRNGTDYQAQGRWHDASLVRWTQGTMRPVGGWEARVKMGSTPPRGAISWRDLSNDRRLAIGSFDQLVVAPAGAVADGTVGAATGYGEGRYGLDAYDAVAPSVVTGIRDITPTDLVAGQRDAAVNLGYGGGFYGTSSYGVARPDTGIYTEATTWSMDTWGEHLVACSTADGRLLEWALGPSSDAAAVTNAPINNRGVFVTDERFLVALGASGNPRKLQWSDRENRTLWSPAATNEAGDIELQTSGQIMQAIRARGQALVLTDQDAHTMTYVGQPFVYSFERVGMSCGAVSRRSAVAMDAGVFWMGPTGFYRFSGGAVSEVQSEVGDYVFSGINSAQISKVWAVANSAHDEVWWFYPSASSIECDRYAVYSTTEGHWAIGSIARTAGVDAGVMSRPIWWGASGIAYDHEKGLNYGGATVFAQSGPVEISGGEAVMSAVELIPDELTQGDVNVAFSTRFHPNDVERSYGPYSLANPTPVRFTGRQASMRVEGARLADWRFGIPRLDVRPGGRR